MSVCDFVLILFHLTCLIVSLFHFIVAEAKRKAKEKAAKGKGKAKLVGVAESEDDEDDKDEVAQFVPAKPARTSKSLKAAKVAKTSANATPTIPVVLGVGTSKSNPAKVLRMTLATKKAKGIHQYFLIEANSYSSINH